MMLLLLLCPEWAAKIIANHQWTALAIPASVAELEPHLARSAVRLDPEEVDAARELVDELHARLVVEGGGPQRRGRVVSPLDLVGASRAGHAEARREVGRIEVPGRRIGDGIGSATDR